MHPTLASLRFAGGVHPGRNVDDFPVWRRWLGCLVALWLMGGVGARAETGAAGKAVGKDVGRIVFQCSDERLNQAFQWAKTQALAYVFSGDPVGDWYEAALPNREAFCMRDVSHQAAGANALGLRAWNKNMFRRFAENISNGKDWCTYWEIDRQNRPAPVDYRNDQDFWYNLPANFDVLNALWRQFLWTGDRSFIDDPVFLNFYERTVKDYVQRWDLAPEKIMARPVVMNVPANANGERPRRVSRGLPSYEEGKPGLNVGADLPASQYAAFMAYANIRKFGGQGDEAEAFFQKAARLKTWFQQTWWSAEQDTYRVFHYPDGRFGDGAGREFILYFGVAAEGHPTRATVDHMLRVKDVNIEMRSYYPEIFFRYGEAAAGLRTLLELSDEHTERRNYPEVSFAIVGAVTQGLMGIEPDGRAGRVATLARLPEASAWARLDQVPVLNTVIGVKHQGLKATELQNTGTQAIVWKACFAGRHATLQVEGPGGPVERKTEEGRGESGDFSGVVVKVEPGLTWRASVP